MLAMNHVFKRLKSSYSIENVLSLHNMEKTASKFATMNPVRLGTPLPSRNAAVLIPLCVIDKKVSILYTLRTPHLKTHRGQVSFPGGKMDETDKNLENTALRETCEELGLTVEDIHVWGRGQNFVLPNQMTVLPVIGQIKKELNLKSLKYNRNEVEEVFAVTLEELCNNKRNRYTQFRAGYSTPVYLGGQRKIWGLTAMITHVFLKALLPATAYVHRIKVIPPVTIAGNQYFGNL